MRPAPTLDKIIAFLRVDLMFACCWPLPPSATKFQIIRDRIFRFLSGVNGAFIIVELAYSISNHLDNAILIMQLACALGIFCEVPLQIYLFTHQHDRLQNVIYKMEDCYKRANVEEKDVFQQYINKYILLYGTVLVLTAASLIGSLSVPLIQSRMFPLEIEYPFRVDYQPMTAMIYFHQALGMYQVTCQVSANVYLALLLWFTTARFEILSNKFRTVTRYSEWKTYIQEHQEILRFAKKMSDSIAHVVLSSLGVSTVALVFGGVTFLSRLPPSVKLQYIIVCSTSLTKVLLCAWPADHLMRTSSNIGEAAYNSLWYNQSLESRKIMLYTLLRCQRPVVISVPGLLKALSFQHYASYLSTAFSYLTTFRIILSDDEETNSTGTHDCLSREATSSMKRITLEKVIAFLKVDLLFACCWPISRDATKFEIVCDKIFRVVSGLHATLLIVELIYTIIYRIENVRMFMQSTCAVGILFEVPLQILLFTLQHDRLQAVILQMEDYYRQIKPEEKDVFQKYVNKYTYIYATTLGMITVALFGSFLEPLFRGSDSYPLVIKYPFSIDKVSLRAIIYFHHTLGLYQAYCQVSSNVFLALLLWFTSARFEILSNKFRMATKYSDWKNCINEHQELLKFAQEVSLSISYVVLSSLGISTYSLVFGGVTILSKLPLSVKAEFAVVCVSSLMKVLLCAWPADYLMTISSDIGDAAYDSLWYKHEVESQKIMLYTLLRCQRPVIITVPGLLTALTFQHYTSYISTAFSFLTTFRIILAEDNI
ncbi:uncharacterized protein [Anoplolepis gracilipes]|uniref:uncharacterized protein n=1 Tax=Anoplolepis gracilipes TaxID=354296 RepID=UPI003BA31D42